MILAKRSASKPSAKSLAFLAGGGDTGAQMRAFDWSKTPLGDPSNWPQSLKTVVGIILDSRYAMWMCWGPELTFFCNDAYLPTLGLKRVWALGSPANRVWEEIWPDIGPRIEQVLAGGGATWDEGLRLFLERSGYAEETYHTFSYSPVHDDEGQISGMLCVVTEATEQILNERRLATLRAAASSLAEMLTEPSMFAALSGCLSRGSQDLPFTLTYLVNPQGELELAQQTGFDTMDPGEWPLADALAANEPLLVDDLESRFAELPKGPWDRRATQALILPIAHQGQSGPAGLFIAGLNPYRPLDEAYRDFLELLVGQVSAGLASSHAHAAAKARADALAELDRAKTTFFSNVSHEFRTPLTLMMGPVEEVLADRTNPVSSTQRKQLETVHRNSVRLLKLVNTMLDFSRIEAGRAKASFEPVQFEQFTAELVSVFRSVIERAGMELEIDVRPLPEPVYIDRDLWEKVVLNLMSNAFKYTLAGQISVMIYPSEGTVKFVVADTGNGIPAAALPRLFERFYRVPDARGRTHEGTGIGLALVHELVKLHGGSIAVESETGRGSRFSVTLPFGKAHLAPQDIVVRSGRDPSPGSTSYVSEAMRWLPDGSDHSLTTSTGIFRPRIRTSGSGKVLLADDNADMRDYVRRILEEAGYDVIAAADGAAGLALARSEQPDLVLSDVMMPNLDGFGLLSSLRGELQTREIPVILLSARAGEEARLEGLQQGADDYLTKPFSTRELIARVGTALASSRARKAVAGALRDEARTLETLNRVGKVVAAELDLDRVVQFVTDAATELTGAAVGAFFYNIEKDEEGMWLYSVSGGAHGDFEHLPARRKSEIFRPTFEGTGIVRSDDITTDPRFTNVPAPYMGMSGHLPVRSYLSVPVLSRSGIVMGGLLFGNSQVGVFTDRSERFAAGIASQAAIAIDNARLYQSAQEELAERERAQRALREADKRKDEFLALLSHELRNPLAPIRNGLQIMKLSGFQHPMQVKAYEVLDRQVSHLVRLVDDLMDVSRITRGKLELRKGPVQLSGIVEAALETVRSLIDEARHKLTVRQPLEPIDLDVDAVRITQVLANLLSNSAKYTPPGGWINVDVSATPQTIEIRVSDNGIGIAPESIGDVFEMFTQLDRVQSRSPGGLGIGLSLVKGLIEMHGGTVSAESEGVGRGSTFIVRLPRNAPAALAGQVTGAVPIRQSRQRVLVVDDNLDSADSMAALLRMMGHEARVANDGAQAIDAARSFLPDVIIMDIGMPNMDGLEASRRIRKLPLDKRPTIVALTGWGQERDRRNSVAAGIDRHLVKPVDADTIAQLLQA